MSTQTILNPSLSLTLNCGISLVNAQSAIGTISQNGNITVTPSLTVGAAAGNVNVWAAIVGTVTSGTPYTLNLLTGADMIGNTLGIVHCCGIYVQNQSVTSGQILEVGVGTNPVMGASRAFDVYPAVTGTPTVYNTNGVMYLNPGYTVTASTSDTLTITAAAGTAVPFILTVFGRNA
jgi:hypothetical protein